MLFKVMLVFNFILLCLIRSRLSCLGSIILLLTPYTKDLQRKFLFSETQGLLDSLQRTFKSMKCDFLTPDLVNLLRYLGDEFCATLSSFLCTRPRNSSCSPHSILAQKSNLPAPGETVKKNVCIGDADAQCPTLISFYQLFSLQNQWIGHFYCKICWADSRLFLLACFCFSRKGHEEIIFSQSDINKFSKWRKGLYK